MGIKAFMPEMNRKFEGILAQVWDEEPQGAGESAREKAMDLIGHLFIFVANLDAESEIPMAFDHQGKARSALGWPRPKPMTYEQLQARGREMLGKPTVIHDEHGTHIFPERPLRTNPKPAVAVDPATGDLQPHPLMRRGRTYSSSVVIAAPPIHPAVRTINEEAMSIPCLEWCPDNQGKWGAGSNVPGHYWANVGASGFVAHTPEYDATLRDPNDPQGEYYEEPRHDEVRLGGYDWREWQPED